MAEGHSVVKTGDALPRCWASQRPQLCYVTVEAHGVVMVKGSEAGDFPPGFRRVRVVEWATQVAAV